MSIETRCRGCGAILRVADQHAGQEARCPQCGQVDRVPWVVRPQPGDVPTAAVAVGSASDWYLWTPEGTTYGPVDRAGLDRWMAEGRIDGSCQLRDGTGGGWQPAESVYPQLARQAVVAATDPTPIVGAQAVPRNASQRHRGMLVLCLGIAGFVVWCPVLSLLAWSMGSADLQLMRGGQMDPEGRGLTEAGRILGMIVSLIWLAFVLLGLLVALLAIVA